MRNLIKVNVPMSNGIIRHKASFNVGQIGQPVILSVGETWVGKRPPLERYHEQYLAALPLAAQVHPYLQGKPPKYSMARLNEEMVSSPGFAVAHTTIYDPLTASSDRLKVWAFGRIEAVAHGIGGLAMRRQPDYILDQFGVTTRERLDQHSEGDLYRKAVAALLFCAVEQLPEEARVHVRIRGDDTRSDDFFRGQAGFGALPTRLRPGPDELFLSATVGEVHDALVIKNHYDNAFLHTRHAYTQPWPAE